MTDGALATIAAAQETGGSSNTPLSAASAYVVFQGTLWALPPVVDTVYISHEGGKPSKQALAWFNAADAIDGDSFQVAQRRETTRMALTDLAPCERGAWEIRQGKLTGFSSYRYVLDGRGDWAGVTVLCAPPDAVDRPWRWYVMVRAERLWKRGHLVGRDAHEVVRCIVRDLGGTVSDAAPMAAVVPMEKWKVSRLDVCRDHGGYEWKIGDLDRFATCCPAWSRGEATGDKNFEQTEAWKAADGGWTYGNPDSTTFYMGRRSSAGKMLRIYCKTTEAEKTGKIEWLAPYWRHMLMANAQGPLPKVWRAEAEFGGGWLKAHGFTNATHLKGCEVSVWEFYAATNRHTAGGTKACTRLRRTKLSKIWSVLTVLPLIACAWTYQPAPEKTEVADHAMLRKQAAGCLANIIKNHVDPSSHREINDEVEKIWRDLKPRLLAKFSPWLAQACEQDPAIFAPTRAERMAANPEFDPDPFSDSPRPEVAHA